MSKDALGDLRAALEERDEKKWLEAVARGEKEGYDGDQIAEALEEIIAQNPVGCHRFMEELHRPPQAMAVLNVGQEADEWELQVHYSEDLIKGALEATWNVYPRVPHEDPWADNVDKAHCEVVGSGGVTLKASGLASRF
mmetsp:Transcript_79333/g.201989  ORF Transcript_79333/g.201989 Transcript_79333/m.201989 type:complete len:139 (-) Transcript_79333:61-477(-)